MNRLITKLTITLTIVHSSSSSLFTPVDLFDSVLKGIPHLLGLGPQYFISNTLFLAGLVTAAITRNERYHEWYAIIFLLQTIAISFTIFRTLA